MTEHDAQQQELNMADWDSRFMDLAFSIRSWSKDTGRRVGCVVVGPSNEVRSTGYNGFPRGIGDENDPRRDRPAKYAWTEHAERNAIYNAARVGIPLEGCRMYVTWFPCMDCGRAIVQCGIGELVCFEPDLTDPRWGEDFANVLVLFQEARVPVRYMTDLKVPDPNE
jgi:dCMP deaminase